MPITYTLRADQCPPVPTPGQYPSASLTLSNGPVCAEGIIFGLGGLAYPALLTRGAARLDLTARLGAGVWAVGDGLVLSPGAGLLVSVAPGHAIIDGVVELAAGQSLVVPDNTASVWVWLLRGVPGGPPSLLVSRTLTLPASPCVLLGSVTTSAGAVTAVDGSGVLRLVGVGAFRQTADAGAPLDAPPATTSFTALTAGGVYDWTGAAYVQKPVPKTVIILPAHSVTATAGSTNDRLGVDFSGVGAFGSASYRVLSCLCSGPLVIVSENLGPKTASKVFFTVYQPSADTSGAFTLTVTLEGTGFAPNPTPTAPTWDSPAAIG